MKVEMLQYDSGSEFGMYLYTIKKYYLHKFFQKGLRAKVVKYLTEPYINSCTRELRLLYWN